MSDIVAQYEVFAGTASARQAATQKAQGSGSTGTSKAAGAGSAEGELKPHCTIVSCV